MVSKVFVVGVGMGNPDTLTHEGRRALESATLIIGAARLLASLEALGLAARTLACARTHEIVSALKEAPDEVAAVAMSGDVGLFSGATGLCRALEETGIKIDLVCGVSSLQYLCARIRRPWEDVRVVSVHGRDADVAGTVQTSEATFVLTGGAHTPATVAQALCTRGLGTVTLVVGERLSYPDERIVRAPAEELTDATFAELSCLIALNPRPIKATAGRRLPDAAFVRGRVPMSKEEVRALVVERLDVRDTDTCWDVGAGTGSVSVALARACPAGQVLAIERDEEALSLIRENRERFGVWHLHAVCGEAPEALEGLPIPDAVFIGGSGGRLKEIVRAALAANPAVRLAITAIALETLTSVLALERELGLRDLEVTQVSIARGMPTGRLRLMRAENPVFLISATGPAATSASGGERA